MKDRDNKYANEKYECSAWEGITYNSSLKQTSTCVCVCVRACDKISI